MSGCIEAEFRVFPMHSTARMGRAQWPAPTCGKTGCCVGHAAAVAEQPRPSHRFSSGTVLDSRQTAPATTGDATLVPLRERQPPPMREPWPGMGVGWECGVGCLGRRRSLPHQRTWCDPTAARPNETGHAM